MMSPRRLWTDTLFANGCNCLDHVSIVRYLAGWCEVGVPVVKYDIEFDVLAKEHDKGRIDAVLVLKIIRQANIIGYKDSTEGQNDDTGHKKWAENLGKTVNKPKERLHKGVKDIIP
jgi:hypothetical protein